MVGEGITLADLRYFRVWVQKEIEHVDQWLALPEKPTDDQSWRHDTAQRKKRLAERLARIDFEILRKEQQDGTASDES